MGSLNFSVTSHQESGLEGTGMAVFGQMKLRMLPHVPLQLPRHSGNHRQRWPSTQADRTQVCKALLCEVRELAEKSLLMKSDENSSDAGRSGLRRRASGSSS